MIELDSGHWSQTRYKVGMTAPAPGTTGATKAAATYNATLVAREEINPSLIVVRAQPDGALFEFKAGQFAVLGLLGG